MLLNTTEGFEEALEIYHIYSTEGILQLKRRIQPPGTSQRWATQSFPAPAVPQTMCAYSRILLFTSTLVHVLCNYLLHIYMNINKTWDSVWAQTPYIEIEVTFRNSDLQLPHSHVLHWDHIHMYSAQTCSQTHPEVNQIATLPNSSLQVSYFFNLRLS